MTPFMATLTAGRADIEQGPRTRRQCRNGTLGKPWSLLAARAAVVAVVSGHEAERMALPLFFAAKTRLTPF